MAETNLENGEGQKQVASADTALIHQVRDGGTQQGVFSRGASPDVSRLLGNVEMSNAVGDGARPATDASQQQSATRIVDGPNGSKIQMEKFPDGQERPNQVTEPDGSVHRYRWQEVNGKITCTAIEDKDPSGKVVGQAALNRDMSSWTIKDPASGQTLRVPGQLTLNSDGTHEFKDPNGKFTRKPTGEAHYVLNNGTEWKEHPLASAAKQPRAGDAPQQRPADAPQQRVSDTPQSDEGLKAREQRLASQPRPDRVQNNENGSKIEFRKVGGREVISAVEHPSGTRTEYSNFDSSGKPQHIEDYDANDKKIAASDRENGQYWRIDGDGVKNGNELLVQGTLNVKPDGTHEFTDTASGNVFTKKADGSITFKDKSGKDLAPPKGPEPISESRKRAVEQAQDNSTLDAVDWSEDSKGDDKADATKYEPPHDDVFDPARPWGLGHFKPGQAGGDDKGLDWRKSKSYTDAAGNTTYKYEGELEDSYWFNIGGDSNFTASETYNKDGKLTGSKVEYASPVDQSFAGQNGQKVTVEDVKSVETTTAPDGTLTTTIKDSSGKGYVVTRNAQGAIAQYRKI